MLPSLRLSVRLFLALTLTFSAISFANADDRKINVRVTNDSHVSVQIHWQVGEDFRATPRNFRYYRALAPGESCSFPSNFGQTWLVFEPRSGRAVGMMKASFRQRHLSISDRDIRMNQGRAYRSVFHNRTGRIVAAYLILGNRALPHSTIAPGRAVSQVSWANQTWEFRDYETGRELRSFVAPAGNAEVVIEPRRIGRRFGGRFHEPVAEILVDNRASRSLLFWFEGQRNKTRIRGHHFETLPFEEKRPWFVTDRATGRYIACGANAPSSRRITITEEACAPALAPTVELTLRNYHDEPAYAYPMLGRDELPGFVLSAGERRSVKSYQGQRWEFRTKDRSRRLGSYQCSASEPSAAIGRPRFQRYRGKVDFTIENRRRRSVDVSVDHDDHIDFLETVAPLTRRVVELDAGDQVVFTDHRSKALLDTARVSLREPVVVLYPEARPVHSESHRHDHRRSGGRPKTLTDLLGDLFKRRR